MEVIKITDDLRKLVPSEDMVLTNGEVYNDTQIYLGCNDSGKDWHEITRAQYDEILKESEMQKSINIE